MEDCKKIKFSMKGNFMKEKLMMVFAMHDKNCMIEKYLMVLLMRDRILYERKIHDGICKIRLG